MEITISRLAEVTRVNKETVRYYEREGLLEPASRNDANYRVYDESSVERIKFIKNAQQLGFKLAEIKELLSAKDTNKACPNALDYISKKLSETKNELKRLVNQRDNLEMLMNGCGKSEDESVCDFFEYLEKNPCLPTSELIFCRHSYLYDAGHWDLQGNFQMNGSPSVPMTGTVDIVHSDNIWNITRELVLDDPDKTRETIHFYIPPAPQEDITQKFVADCSVFGDVVGSIAFAGEDIFKHSERPNQNVKGYEYLKRIHTDLYEARGVLSDGTKSLTWWDYELERAEKTLN